MADVDSRTGARYADAGILEYTQRVHVEHDAALQQAFDAPERFGMPAIQVSPSEGKLLGMLIALCGARRVVEVGTLAGYSAIHIARALPEGGKLYTIELEPKHAEVARANLAAAGVLDRVEVLVGEGASMLEQLAPRGPFDVLFLDADKAGYPRYAAWGAGHLRKGGLLLADNSYYFGALLGQDASAVAMRRFHESLPAAFESVCVPTPDGLVVAIRK
jgi:caffeoyl-CoA O-methyltransferase